MQHEFGLYIHWPFCLKKCPYCDFNSYAFKHEPEMWVEALLDELEIAAMAFNCPYNNENSENDMSIELYQNIQLLGQKKTHVFPEHIKNFPNHNNFNSENIMHSNKEDSTNISSNEKCFTWNIYSNQNKSSKWKMRTIFFGGGTPSLIPPHHIKRLIEKAKSLFSYDDDLEITLETNPSTIETHNLEEFLANGINRFSIGMQSLNNEKLKFLGRLHSSQEAIEILTHAAKICDNVSGDFIYALPTDSLDIWKKDLDQIMQLVNDINLKHCSLYQLTIENGTSFEQSVAAKLWKPMDEDLQSELYEHTFQTLRENNWDFYEISNAAKIPLHATSNKNVSRETENNSCEKNYTQQKKSPHRSKHNLIYWNYGNYLGVGAGAHSRMMEGDNKIKFNNVKNPYKWLEKINSIKHDIVNSDSSIWEDQKIKRMFLSQKEDVELLDEYTAFQEKMLMGLRLTDGVFVNQNFMKHLNLINLNMLIKEKFVEIENKEGGMQLFLPLNGRLKLNAILKLLFD